MQINITGKNIKITADIRDFINKKVRKVIRDLESPIDCNIVLTKEKKRIVTEIILHGDHGKFCFKKSAEDVYSSVEQVIHSADLSVKKFKDKQKDRKPRGKQQISSEIPSREGPQIVDYKIEGLKPMSLEETFLQMKYLRKRFIIFIYSGTEKINIMFRDGGDILLIKPVTKIKQFFKLKKYALEKCLIEYKNNEIKIKKRQSFEPLSMEISEVIENLKNNRSNFIIFKDKAEDKLFVMFWLGVKKIGRCLL